MTDVILKPMPEKYRQIPKRLRPGRPPFSIFQNVGPEGVTEDDKELARELYKLLDEDSKDWYGRHGIFEGL